MGGTGLPRGYGVGTGIPRGYGVGTGLSLTLLSQARLLLLFLFRKINGRGDTLFYSDSRNS